MQQNKAALESFLACAAGASRVEVLGFEYLAGGSVQENWRLIAEVSGGPYAGLLDVVLRTDAASALPESHSREGEFALLQAAHVAGVTVPEPLWLCVDAAVAGKPFFIMRRMPGVAARYRVAKDLALAPDRAALVRRLARELARIHAVRPGGVELAFLPEPSPGPALFWVDRYRRYLDDLGWPYPGLEWGLRWLALNAPAKPAEGVVLCHNDFRTGNYLVDETGLTAILDWEFAGWGDPLADIGWFCARCWRSGRDALEAGGIGSRADFYAAYEAASGRTIDANAVAYWEVFAHVRYAVIAAQQAARASSGDGHSLELALIGHAIPELELEILRMTEPD